MKRAIRLSMPLAIGMSATLVGTTQATGAPPGGGGGGFFTSQPAQLVPLASGIVIKPLLSAGDVVGGYQATGVMDGLGVYRISSTQIGVMVNHELEGDDPTWARVSKLTLSNTGGTLAGSYPIDGTEGYDCQTGRSRSHGRYAPRGSSCGCWVGAAKRRRPTPTLAATASNPGS